MEFGIFNLMGSRDPAKPTAQVFGEVAEQTKLADELAARAGKDERTLSHVGCGYALCAAAAEGDEPDGLTSEQRLPAEKYRRSALDALAKAAENGWDDGQTWRLDPDLDALCGHPRFAELLAKLP